MREIMEETMQRRLMLSQAQNCRDLGGYPLEGGGATAWRRFIRSGMPTGVTREDLQTLRDADITTVVDLRCNWERAQEACALEGVPGILYHQHSLLGEERWVDRPDETPRRYFDMTKGEAMGRVMKVLANAPGGVLFHCRAGKDRTSVVAAILLMLAGVGRADIMADYIQSSAYLQVAWERPDFQFPLRDVLPRLEYIDGFMTLFREAYGDARSYLAGMGLSREEIGRLRGRLTGTAPMGRAALPYAAPRHAAGGAGHRAYKAPRDDEL